MASSPSCSAFLSTNRGVGGLGALLGGASAAAISATQHSRSSSAHSNRSSCSDWSSASAGGGGQLLRTRRRMVGGVSSLLCRSAPARSSSRFTASGVSTTGKCAARKVSARPQLCTPAAMK
eukprot:1184513-Prorocentrum_minimum.AAC.2